jgi:hypothetical protein
MDPLHRVAEPYVSNPVQTFEHCDSEHKTVWVTFTVIHKAVLTAYGIFLATKTRNVPKAYNGQEKGRGGGEGHYPFLLGGCTRMHNVQWIVHASFHTHRCSLTHSLFFVFSFFVAFLFHCFLFPPSRVEIDGLLSVQHRLHFPDLLPADLPNAAARRLGHPLHGAGAHHPLVLHVDMQFAHRTADLLPRLPAGCGFLPGD